MKKRRNVSVFLLYCFGFLLLAEWIWPVEQLTDTANTWVFFVFLAFSIFLSLLQVPLLLSGFLKGAVIVYFLHRLYFEEAFFQTNWVLPFLLEFKNNMSHVFSAHWLEFSNLFRSFLVFILLWIMAYLLHYWLIQKRKIFIFFFMTIVYMTVLDTFTAYDADNAIVRTIIIGFTAMGILTLHRLLDREAIEKEGYVPRRWMIPLSVMVTLSVILGFALPKADPIWPDPVPYLQALNEDGDMGSVHRVGYGTDDSRLGGPFIGDRTVVFRTAVESEHYWKVETKDVYTGKGWVQSDKDAERIPFAQDSDIPITSFVEGDTVEKTVETSTVYQVKEYPHVLYPLGGKKIQAGKNYSYEVDPSIEKIYSLEGSRDVAMPRYSLTFEMPRYSVTALKSTENRESSGLSTEFFTRYTQLPDALPQRVIDLASEITTDEITWFDKAKAVEQYLRGTKYMYDTKNVLIPGKEDDYVDQFLFESMQGYCDNFSSSMAVLLRSLDIPARWVKGYTEGEYDGLDANDSNLRLFDITNNNAHSWVEVYLPQVGWVPFEPTPGFTNDVSFYDDEVEKAENLTPPTQMEQPKQNEINPQTSTDQNEEFSFMEIWQGVKGFFTHYWSLILIAVLISSFYIYRIRVKWLPTYYIWRYKRLEKDDCFAEAYIVLLKQLDRCGLKRRTGQTLKEYALWIDQLFSTKEMTQLTIQYEQYIYGNRLKKGTWIDTRKLWENLIKKTIA